MAMTGWDALIVMGGLAALGFILWRVLHKSIDDAKKSVSKSIDDLKESNNNSIQNIEKRLDGHSSELGDVATLLHGLIGELRGRRQAETERFQEEIAEALANQPDRKEK